MRSAGYLRLHRISVAIWIFLSVQECACFSRSALRVLPSARVSACRSGLCPAASVVSQARSSRRAVLTMVGQTSKSAPPKNIRGVLFDIDGTLFNSDPVHFAVFQELFLEMGFNNGVPIDEEFFRTKIAGRQNAIICADLFPDWSVEKGEEWSAFKEQKFRERAVGKLEAMPGLDRIIAFIDKRQMKKAAVTNAPRANAEFMLSVINRGSWFTELIIGDECERAKPDPMPYLIAMERLGLKPEETIVFEDSPSGAAAGVASGAYTIGILSSQSADKLLAVGCGLVVRDYDDPALWNLLEAAADK